MFGALNRRRLSTPILVALVAGVLFAPQAHATTATITGVAFKDLNRNAQLDAGEEPWSGHQLYLFDVSGNYVANASTDASGRYSFNVTAGATYTVAYDASSWNPLRNDWTPTTTTSIKPEKSLTVASATQVDFGWRPITWSTTLGSPISSFTGPEGLRVESYNDAVSARQVYDAAIAQTVGAEAPSVTLRFGFGSTSSTSTGVQGSKGSYSNFRADVYVSFDSWLDEGDQTLAHEYGHAWSLYYDHIVQQDGDLGTYLEARGLTGDPRVNQDYGWSAREMIAEDYRQLLGSPTARQRPQMNSEIPPASQVAGLEDFLRNTFTTAPASAAAPVQTADTTAPTAPGSLTARAGKGSVSLSWSSSQDDRGVTGYEVWRKSGKTSYSLLASVSGQSFTDSGLKRGAVYTYKVHAIDAAGNRSAASNEATAKAL